MRRARNFARKSLDMDLNFYSLPLKEIVDETPDAYTLVFDAGPMRPVQFFAGQYLTLRVWLEGAEHRRAFSLSSSPLAPDELAITVKRIPGGLVSNYLRDQLKPGDTVEAMRPMGSFKIHPEPGRAYHYILIGAGSGITPLMSMARTALAVEPESKVTLWYGNRSREQVIFAEALEALKSKYGARLTVLHFLTQAADSWKGPRGRLTAPVIYELLSDLFMEDMFERKGYFLCGPEGMIAAAEKALDQHAVDPRFVYKEFFTTPLTYPEPDEEEDEEAEIDWPEGPVEVEIRLRGQKHILAVAPRQTLLSAARKSGLEVPYSCLGGVCTTCRAYLEQGEVIMEEYLGLSDEELEAGYVLTCQAVPLAEGVKVDYDKS